MYIVRLIVWIIKEIVRFIFRTFKIKHEHKWVYCGTFDCGLCGQAEDWRCKVCGEHDDPRY